MPIEVRITGLQEISTSMRPLPEKFERSVMLQMSQIAYDMAQRGAGRHNKTGALLQSLYNRAIPKGREVGHDPQRAPHALFVNFGTKPHAIVPRNKKALRWASGGRFHFAKRVQHPGYRGDAYIIEAATEALRGFQRIVDAAFKESI